MPRDVGEAEQQLLERLDVLETGLVALDRGADSGDVERGSVHSLFREAHNLKSALSLAGYESLSSLTHALESCLDMLRAGARARPEWTDLFLDTVDLLRLAILDGEEAVAERALGLREGLEALAGILRAEDHGRQPEIGFPLDFLEAEDLSRALHEGLSLYMLEKLVSAGMSKEAVAGLPVQETLAGIGRIIAMRILEADSSQSLLRVLFTTSFPAAEIGFSIFDPFYPIQTKISSAPNDAVHDKKEGTEARKRKQPKAVPRPPRILIVDDDPTALLLLQLILSPYGRVDTAMDGQEALDKFSDAFKSERYGYVFMDIRMPRLSGDLALKAIRNLEKEGGVLIGEGARVVMSTALSDFSTISASFRDQCDSYLVKPYERKAVETLMLQFGVEPMDLGGEKILARD